MSSATFDGQAHTLTVRDRNGNVVATARANNRTDSHATLHFVANGNYTPQDTSSTHRHGGTADTVNGEYGSSGIARFNVPGHLGVGIHAGRQTTADRTPERSTGPDHVTQGCIRTTDEMMQSLSTLMATDPLNSVSVINNRRQRR